MNYSINHIRRAFELAEIPSDFAERIIEYLPEAVRQLETVQAETLNDFFGQFCIKNEVTEGEMKSRKKVDRLAKLRKKYVILAKQYFPDEPNKWIGREINRDASSVWCILENEQIRQEKQENQKTIKKRGHLPVGYSKESINRLVNQILRVFPKFFDNFEGWEYGNGADAGKHFSSIYDKAKKLRR